MAMNKEAIVFVLDVGKSKNEARGSAFLNKSLECLTKILQRKIFSESKDEIGLVLCGTSDTRNPLATNTEYRNIVLFRELGPVNWPFMRAIVKIEPSSDQGDLLDALVVAMDHLVTSTRIGKFAAREIYFLSDLTGEVSCDQLETIIKGLNNENIGLIVIGPDLKDSSQQTTGVRLLRKILDDVDGSSHTFDEVVPLISFFKRKTIRPTPWKVSLEVAPSLYIPVCCYVKVKKSQMKPWKKAYAKDPAAKIVTEISYHKKGEMQEAIEKSETIKAYRYGRTLVPFSDEDKANMAYVSGGKSLKVLGFTKQSNIKRHHFLGDGSSFVIADKAFVTAGVALSAIIHALHETDSVAIVRHVYSARSDPKMGMLAPRIKAKYECLVFVQLPFAEDLRQLTLPALDSDAKNIPTDEQLDVMDELIDAMDLTNTKAGELIRPRNVLNPEVQRLYQCIVHRAHKPEDPLPNIDEELIKMFSPEPNILAAGEVVGKKIKSLFHLEEVVSKKDKKTAASFFQKTPDDDQPPSKYAKLNADDLEDVGVATFVRMEVTEVGTIDPTSDFLEMIRSNPEEFASAFKQMTKVILQLVMDLFGTLLTEENHKKALSCLKVLRKESIAKSSIAFNRFLREFRDSLLAKEKRSFFIQMRNHDIGLITRQEDDSSDSSAFEAQTFFVCDATKEEPSTASYESEDEEDLLNNM